MLITDPTGLHVVTVIALHGFTSNGAELKYKLDLMMPPFWASHARVLYPNAPVRPISCYGGQRCRSWHDYFSNYGDTGIAKEEKIDVGHLKEMRGYLAELAHAEMRRGRPVWMLGESQGACVALDIAVHVAIPVIMMYGQRYSVTPSNENAAIVRSFHGENDTVISSHMAIASVQSIAGDVKITSARGYEHVDTGPRLARFLNSSVSELLKTG